MELAQIAGLLDARPEGYSLPQALYNDPAMHEFDLRAVFATSWLIAGFEVQLPKPGSYLSFTIGSWPLLLVRGTDGEIRGFHNSCRHRGARLCAEGEGRRPKLVCPYHQWTYNLDGTLSSAGRMPEMFDKAMFGLRPVHVECRAGVIFVCLAEDPPAFDTLERDLVPLLAPHALANAKVAFESTMVEHANWKLVMENARECFHCLVAHPELSRTFPIGASGYFDYGQDVSPERFRARMEEAGLPVGPVGEDWWQALRFPLNEGCVSMTLDGQPAVRRLMCEAGGGDIGSLRWALEPNSFAHSTSDFTFVFTASPVGPKETIVTARWLVHKDAVEGVDYDLKTLTELWTQTNLQDKALAENNQAGVDSLGYQPGPYSAEAEELVIRFTDWYCAKAKAYLATALERESASRVACHAG